MAKSVAVIALQRQLFSPALLSLCLTQLIKTAHSTIILSSIPSKFSYHGPGEGT